jgi:hypothetical protein
MAMSPNCVQSRTPTHEGAGCDVRHRLLPDVDAANGMPRKMVTPGLWSDETPATKLVSIRTGSAKIIVTEPAAHEPW